MLTAILNFFHMGGYGFYVWSSYGIVMLLLSVQWFAVWRRWKKYLRHIKEQKTNFSYE